MAPFDMNTFQSSKEKHFIPPIIKVPGILETLLHSSLQLSRSNRLQSQIRRSRKISCIRENTGKLLGKYKINFRIISLTVLPDASCNDGHFCLYIFSRCRCHGAPLGLQNRMGRGQTDGQTDKQTDRHRDY